MEFFKAKLFSPLIQLLKQGLTPQKLAWSVVAGIALGIFPMIGATTLLCLIFTWIFRLNPVAIQVVNYFIYPIQLALFIPFFQLGAKFFGSGEFEYTIGQIFEILTNDTWNAILNLWVANVRAILVWAVTVTPLTLLGYFIMEKIFDRAKKKLKPNNSIRIEIYSKPDCELCDIAKEEVEKFKDRYRLEISEVNIEANGELFEKYKFDIPLIFINGRKAFKHKIQAEVLERKLKALQEV